MEKDLHSIGIIIDDESMKDSKDVGRKSRAVVSKVKEKETSEIEILTRLLKSLIIEVVELKEWTSEMEVSSRPSSCA